MLEAPTAPAAAAAPRVSTVAPPPSRPTVVAAAAVVVLPWTVPVGLAEASTSVTAFRWPPLSVPPVMAEALQASSEAVTAAATTTSPTPTPAPVLRATVLMSVAAGVAAAALPDLAATVRTALSSSPQSPLEPAGHHCEQLALKLVRRRHTALIRLGGDERTRTADNLLAN